MDLHSLPAEILSIIAGFLEIADLLSMRLTCAALRDPSLRELLIRIKRISVESSFAEGAHVSPARPKYLESFLYIDAPKNLEFIELSHSLGTPFSEKMMGSFVNTSLPPFTFPKLRHLQLLSLHINSDAIITFLQRHPRLCTLSLIHVTLTQNLWSEVLQHIMDSPLALSKFEFESNSVLVFGEDRKRSEAVSMELDADIFEELIHGGGSGWCAVGEGRVQWYLRKMIEDHFALWRIEEARYRLRLAEKP